ncbi:hypothetical protein DFJ77DRAFT_515122 [Powellomyces hirtus]|nr:hypothetical protein DFJ77DRAFT_515122 [Powellomyces hirtus]
MSVPFRAHYADDAGLHLAPAIANVQVHQEGFALDFQPSHLDRFGRPRVISSFSRVTRLPNDNATRSARARIDQATRSLPSLDPLILHPPKVTTKAYRDGMEYVQAESDFRQKEQYLDSITPTRRSGLQQSVGTSNSLSGLPIPDQGGNVYHYSDTTRAQTGLGFVAPFDSSTEIPIGMATKNENSRHTQPVIMMNHREIRTDQDGKTSANLASGVVFQPPAQVSADAFIPEIPQLFPGSYPNPSPPVEMTDAVPEYDVEQAMMSESSRRGSAPKVVASTAKDSSDVEAILAHNAVYGNTVTVPARSPFAATRQKDVKSISLQTIGPHTSGRLVRGDLGIGQTATAFDPTALAIPLSVHVPKAVATIVTHDMSGLRATTGGTPLQATSLRTSGVKGRLKRPFSGESDRERKTRKMTVPGATGALVTQDLGILNEATRVDPLQPINVQTSSSKGKLKRSQLEDGGPRVTKKRKVEALPTIPAAPIPRTITASSRSARRAPRATRVLNVQDNPTAGRAVPPPAPIVPVPPPVVRAPALRPLAKLRRDDPDFGIASTIPQTPYVEPQLRTRLRKGQAPLTYPNRESALYVQTGEDLQKRRRKK